MALCSFKERNIINGPSKLDVMIAHYHGDIENRHVVKFQLAKGSGAWIDVIITTGKRKDGSGELWFFEGSVVIGKDKQGLQFGPFFEAQFDFRNRKGWMRIDKRMY